MTNEDSIYKPPASNLIEEAGLPEEFVRSSFTAKKLSILGWMAIGYFVISFPILAFSFLSGLEAENHAYEYLYFALTLLDTCIYIYLLWMLREYLKYRYHFSRADKQILALIGLMIIWTLLTFLMPDEQFDSVTVAYFVVMVVVGITAAWFGKRLLSIKESNQYLRQFSWLNILYGVLLATVVLFLFALLFALASDVFLALIFFQAARERKKLELN